jgi:uncharacterized protein (DUF1800 family)
MPEGGKHHHSMVRLLALCVLLTACAAGVDHPAAPAPITRQLTGDDVRWLNRVTFGVDSAALARYRQLGRARFLDEQLIWLPPEPPDLAAAIAALGVTQQTAEQLLRQAQAEQRRIAALPSEDDKQQARAAHRQAALQASHETATRHLMRALYSPAQLREQMTWFWMNHFNVFAGKGTVSWTLAEYEEQVVRRRALGQFCDLVLATSLSPTMLEYLDNNQSTVGRVNENYARELMELHTLGVSGGPSGSRYSQSDVQEVARVLTGVGIAGARPPTLAPKLQPLHVRQGLFEFNPAQHDFGVKVVLGSRIEGHGLPEVGQVVTLLCRHPAAARFISGKIATYFVADNPPPALVDAMVTTFQRTDGNIAAVLKTMFMSPILTAALADAQAGKFKDPTQFIVSSLRLAYDGTVIANYRPMIGWLNQLGQPLYGRVTPDGYALVERAWASPGQLIARFEIARAIGSGRAGLVDAQDDNQRGIRTMRPTLNNGLFHEAIEPALGARTRAALARASEGEWNMVLLASPEWMQR